MSSVSSVPVGPRSANATDHWVWIRRKYVTITQRDNSHRYRRDPDSKEIFLSSPSPSPQSPVPTGPRRQISQDEAEKDPVEVYCRLRPGEEDNNCVKIVSDTTVQLAPPSSRKSNVSGKELQCGFKCE